jgi:hypothetical protein
LFTQGVDSACTFVNASAPIFGLCTRR